MKMLRYEYLMREEEEEQLFNVYVPYLTSFHLWRYLPIQFSSDREGE